MLNQCLEWDKWVVTNYRRCLTHLFHGHASCGHCITGNARRHAVLYTDFFYQNAGGKQTSIYFWILTTRLPWVDITYSRRLLTCLNCLNWFSKALLIDLRVACRSGLYTLAIEKGCFSEHSIQQNNKADLSFVNRLSTPAYIKPFKAYCCHMGTAIKHPVPDRVKPSFNPDVKNYKWWLNPVWHRMLYSCTHMATVGFKGLNLRLEIIHANLTTPALSTPANSAFPCPAVVHVWLQPRS